MLMSQQFVNAADEVEYESREEEDYSASTVLSNDGPSLDAMIEEAAEVFRPPVNQMSPVRCQQCRRDMFIQDHFACFKCDLWNVCAPCIEDHHMQHLGTVHLYRFYLHRFDTIRSWICHFANEHIDFIRSMQKQLQAVYDDYNSVIDLTPCRSDPIFLEVVTEYAMDVNGYRVKFTKAAKQYANLERTVQDLMSYLENREWPCGSKYRIPFIASIYERVIDNDEVSKVFRWIDFVVEDAQIKGAQNALNRLRGTNNLLRMSFTPQKPKNGQDEGVEKKPLKSRMRSRSVRD